MEEFLAQYQKMFMNMKFDVSYLLFWKDMEKPLKLKFIYTKITRIYIHNFSTIASKKYIA